jgi:ribosomal protein L19
VVAKYRFYKYELHYEGKLRIRSQSYCIIEVATKAGLTECFLFRGGGHFGYGIEYHFQQYFSYIVAVSVIGGGNWRKPSTCRKPLTNFIT